MVVSEDDRALTLLLLILCSAGRPNYLFDQIVSWARETYIRCGPSFFETKQPKRETVVSRFSKNKLSDFPKPGRIAVPLEYTEKQGTLIPSSEKSIKTVVFDFIHQLQRVLQDPEVSKPVNTILDKDDPYKPYEPNLLLENIQDGMVFQKTVEKYKCDKDEFVVGLICYTDKTHATQDGRFTAEPVVMVPSFLTLSEMRKPERQIILGLVSDLDRKSSAAKHIQSKGAPCRNYHSQLRVLFQALHRIHEKGGLWMRLRLHGHERVVKLILPLIAIKGDAKSQDNLVG